MGSIKKIDDDVVVRMDIRRVIMSNSWFRHDGKLIKVNIAHIIGMLAWALVKVNAPNMVKGRKFLSTQMTFDEKTHEIVFTYTNKPMGVIMAPEEE